MNTLHRLGASLALSLLMLCACAQTEPLRDPAEATPPLPTPTGPERVDADAPRGHVIVGGVPFPCAVPVVTWKDPEGYDGYLERCHFKPDRVEPLRPAKGCEGARRYGSRRGIIEGTESKPPDLATLRTLIDQFVLHYDACGTSRRCFEILHDVRGLSVHFLLDLDGTLYQTLDIAERARHATISNDRSVGIEIAHIGASSDPKKASAWYGTEGVLTLPESLRAGASQKPGFVPRAARPLPVQGKINGRDLWQLDFTDAQYTSLIALTRTLCNALPRLERNIPRDVGGDVVTRTLSLSEWERFRGILGHFHVQKNKADPGPAFDWERVMTGVLEPRPTP